MQNKEKAAIFEASLDGAEIEYRAKGGYKAKNGNWVPQNDDIWDFDGFDYRVKPVEYWANIYDDDIYVYRNEIAAKRFFRDEGGRCGVKLVEAK